MTLLTFIHESFTNDTLGAYACRAVIIGSVTLAAWAAVDAVKFFGTAAGREKRIQRLQVKIEHLRWAVLFDLTQHDRLVPKIQRLTDKLHRLGGKRLDELPRKLQDEDKRAWGR